MNMEVASFFSKFKTWGTLVDPFYNISLYTPK